MGSFDGFVVRFKGLSGSGKSTLASMPAAELVWAVRITLAVSPEAAELERVEARRR